MVRRWIGYCLLALLSWACSSSEIRNISVEATPEEEDDIELSEVSDQLNAIRAEGFDGMIEINLSKGVHRLIEPLVIKPEHGPLTIKGEDADASIISGSMVLNLDWEIYKDQIRVAQIDSQLVFDQLYINGNAQILARYPNYDEDGGHWQGHAADAIDPERISDWNNPIGAVVHAMHRGEWGGMHYRVEGREDYGELVLTGGFQNNRPSSMHPKYRMVENVFEELDSPGEWYNDGHGKLYFWPENSDELATASVEVVQLKNLLTLEGSTKNPVQNVQLKDIKFQHARRTLFEEYEPLLRSDWQVFRGGAVMLEGCENVLVEGCTFTQLGGNVIFLSGYNREVKIHENHIYECGATAINIVGRPEAVRSPSFQYSEFQELSNMDTLKGPKTNEYPADCTIDNNLIYRIGRIEKQTAGVNISMSKKIMVSNNSIYEVPRAGINICDGTWGGHVIEFNDVFKTVLESGDHGAFNSWGRDRFWHPNRDRLDEIVANHRDMITWDAMHKTIIRNNRFRCDHGWDIDLDDGSSNYEIYNNVCLNGGIKLREGFYRTVRNNIMINNGFHPHVWFEESGDVFTNNILMTGYRDIRLNGWGKELDYNLFPSEKSLLEAQAHNVEENGMYGDPEFIDPQIGNYRVKKTSPALELGFRNFEIKEAFGVKNRTLRKLAEKPEIPIIWSVVSEEDNLEMDWLGAKIKTIQTMEERSAAGLNETAGVLILSIQDNSVLSKSDLQVGDVILRAADDEVKTVVDLMRSYQENSWRGKLGLEVFRNQASQKMSVSVK